MDVPIIAAWGRMAMRDCADGGDTDTFLSSLNSQGVPPLTAAMQRLTFWLSEYSDSVDELFVSSVPPFPGPESAF